MVCGTIRMLPPASDPVWEHIARHEAGHAVAYVLASLDLFDNTLGCQYVEIRPGRTDFRIDSRGHGYHCHGVCETSKIYESWRAETTRLLRDNERMRQFLPSRIRAAEWEIVACLAGPYAEWASRGCRGRDSLRWHTRWYGGADGDLEVVDAVFEDLCILTKRRASMTRLRARARQLVFDYAEAIDALTSVLLERQQLEHTDVISVIASYLPLREQALAA